MRHTKWTWSSFTGFTGSVTAGVHRSRDGQHLHDPTHIGHRDGQLARANSSECDYHRGNQRIFRESSSANTSPAAGSAAGQNVRGGAYAGNAVDRRVSAQLGARSTTGAKRRNHGVTGGESCSVLRGEFSDNNYGNAERHVHADSHCHLLTSGVVRDGNEEHTLNPDRAVIAATREHQLKNFDRQIARLRSDRY